MIPNDTVMLYGYINMKLRDFYSNLEMLCEDLELDETELIERLGDAGYCYDEEVNRFVPL
ncbi:MAG: DUF4250 domain-containing protein [Eubacteriales bacterium]|nr:DUF4250 domain-containing protein [Eubacteriales bacterium]